MKKKNKEILDDVQKYLKDDLEHSKETNIIKEKKQDDSQNIKEMNFEQVVRSEVKEWIKKNAKKLSNIAIEDALKDIDKKKKIGAECLVRLL